MLMDNVYCTSIKVKLRLLLVIVKLNDYRIIKIVW